MLSGMVLRTAVAAMSALFGSLGVFFVYLSFLKPGLAVHAVVFLTIALAILWSSPQK